MDTEQLTSSEAYPTWKFYKPTQKFYKAVCYFNRTILIAHTQSYQHSMGTFQRSQRGAHHLQSPAITQLIQRPSIAITNQAQFRMLGQLYLSLIERLSNLVRFYIIMRKFNRDTQRPGVEPAAEYFFPCLGNRKLVLINRGAVLIA